MGGQDMVRKPVCQLMCIIASSSSSAFATICFWYPWKATLNSLRPIPLRSSAIDHALSCQVKKWSQVKGQFMPTQPYIHHVMCHVMPLQIQKQKIGPQPPLTTGCPTYESVRGKMSESTTIEFGQKQFLMPCCALKMCHYLHKFQSSTFPHFYP